MTIEIREYIDTGEKVKLYKNYGQENYNSREKDSQLTKQLGEFK